MPRNMSFALTTEAVRQKQKTVTRRLGWAFLRPGDVLQPVVKAQGIPKGGKVEKIGGLIHVTSVTRAALSLMLYQTSGPDECRREGFPHLTPEQFVAMFIRSHKGCFPHSQVTRIEFEYTEDI